MVRNVIAVGLGCLYVAGSIWLVDSAGRRYRANLGTTRRSAPVIEKSPASLPAENGKKKTEAVIAARERKPSQVQASPSPSAPTTIAASDATRASKTDSAASPPNEVAKAQPPTFPPANKAPEQPVGTGAAPANPLTTDSFWSQRELTKAWDLANLKTDDEQRLGAEFHDLIAELNLLGEQDVSLLSRVEDAAEPFLKTLRRKEIKYKFFLLNSDAVSAFSTPGGYIYISRGLLEWIGEEEDDALQFAIGHEIAHVDLQHAIRCLNDPGVVKMTEGTLQKLYWLIIPFGYLVSDSVNQDLEADEWVCNRMRGFGRSKREILIFVQRLAGYAETHGFKNGRVKPRSGQDLSPLDNHYRAHTAALRRLKHLKGLMEPTAKAAK